MLTTTPADRVSDASRFEDALEELVASVSDEELEALLQDARERSANS